MGRIYFDHIFAKEKKHHKITGDGCSVQVGWKWAGSSVWPCA